MIQCNVLKNVMNKMKKLLFILLCVPLIGIGQIVDTISEKKENNLPPDYGQEIE